MLTTCSIHLHFEGSLQNINIVRNIIKLIKNKRFFTLQRKLKLNCRLFWLNIGLIVILLYTATLSCYIIYFIYQSKQTYFLLLLLFTIILLYVYKLKHNTSKMIRMYETFKFTIKHIGACVEDGFWGLKPPPNGM